MNTLGRKFRLAIFGESHGPAVGIVIDGCPPGVDFPPPSLNQDLGRRRPGGVGTTARVEKDVPRVISGVFEKKTTGAPLTLVFDNQDVDSSSYRKMKDTPRPSHADFVAFHKFSGYNDYRGGGHFSGRLTLPLVAAGSLAKALTDPLDYRSVLVEAGGDPDPGRAAAKAAENQDSVGGLIETRISGLPIGLGEPFFDSVESCLAHIIFAIPGVKGIEFGAGFSSARMSGTQYNDAIIDTDGKTETNWAGGINGGITNGNEIVFRTAMRPTASIASRQKTIDITTGQPVELEISGRHDACIALRAPVVMEAAAAIVICDLMMSAGMIPGAKE